MTRALRGMLVAIVALALAEVGLRLAFAEHEADRAYWGRGAFVVEEGYPYRFAPNVEAWAGREASFAHTVRTNSLGFRDSREPPQESRGRRAIVAGASFAFGLGVTNATDVFHVRLEQHLRERPDWPADLEIYNVSQSGYNLSSILKLIEDHGDRFEPEIVFLIVSPRAFRPQTAMGSEVVYGYRLAPDRIGRGTVLDWLRTHSYLVMRAVNPFEGGLAFHRDRVFGAAQTEDVDEEGLRRRLVELGAFARTLREKQIALFLIPVAGATRTAPILKRAGYRVIDLPSVDAWVLPHDMHWNSTGHRTAAAITAKQLPSYRRARRLSQ